MKRVLILAMGLILACSTSFARSAKEIKEERQTSTPMHNGHEYVDLGLSVKWATCNVGASKPEEYGDYFAWGETKPKSDYYWGWDTYKWCRGDFDSFTKYCTDSYHGIVDNKKQLELSDDAAHANWGGSWRMPTHDELTELKEKCTWTWTTQNGVKGYKVTSKINGRSIFLPAAGIGDDSCLEDVGLDGYYWSSSLDTGATLSAMSVYFSSSNVNLSTNGRCCGLSVRPVCAKEVKEERQTSTPMHNGHEYVDLGLSVKWATCNVGASKPEEYGDYFAWGETTTKSSYSWSTYKWCRGDYDNLTKYCTSSIYGTVDNKEQLDISDDAARANWGGSWRMPTRDELIELREKCTWTWTTQNGVNGYKVTSKTNGRSIFLPAAGYRSGSSLYDAGSGGGYWSSSLRTDGPDYARYVFFDSSGVAWTLSGRCYGQSVRTVCP